MDMQTLFTDFKKHVGDMTDEDVIISISNAINHTRLDEFITFAKTEYGLTVEAVESDTPDTFEKIFQCQLSEGSAGMINYNCLDCTHYNHRDDKCRIGSDKEGCLDFEPQDRTFDHEEDEDER